MAFGRFISRTGRRLDSFAELAELLVNSSGLEIQLEIPVETLLRTLIHSSVSQLSMAIL